MTIRIALLVAFASLAASSVAVQAATPADPDKAPIAAVDRFSDKASFGTSRPEANS